MPFHHLVNKNVDSLTRLYSQPAAKWNHNKVDFIVTGIVVPLFEIILNISSIVFWNVHFRVAVWYCGCNCAEREAWVLRHITSLDSVMDTLSASIFNFPFKMKAWKFRRPLGTFIHNYVVQKDISTVQCIDFAILYFQSRFQYEE